jgi:hypothetical protein
MPLLEATLRVVALLVLAVLVIALMLPFTRRSRPVRALRTAVTPWLPATSARLPLLARRALGAVGAVFGVGCFVWGDAALAAAGYVLAIAGIVIYGA